MSNTNLAKSLEAGTARWTPTLERSSGGRMRRARSRMPQRPPCAAHRRRRTTVAGPLVGLRTGSSSTVVRSPDGSPRPRTACTRRCQLARTAASTCALAPRASCNRWALRDTGARRSPARREGSPRVAARAE